MKSIITNLFLLSMITTSIHARTWTDAQGRTIEAKVVKVNSSKTVVLKTTRGKTVTVPFETFVEADVAHLEMLLSQQRGDKLHAVSWSQLNELFGVEIWQDNLLWDDPTADVAERMDLKKESKNDYMENHRAYPFGKQKILSEPVYTIVLYGGEEEVTNLSFLFRGSSETLSKPVEKEDDHVEKSGMRLHDVITSILGKPKRDSLGKGDLREKVWRWDWNKHAILLTMQQIKYPVLRIMPSQRADHSGCIAKLPNDELKKRMASSVKRRNNGDVVIQNIPMINNQTSPDYNPFASIERYLRYMGFPSDIYLLALAGKSGIGTELPFYKKVIKASGHSIESLEGSISMKEIADYINAGQPIILQPLIWYTATSSSSESAPYLPPSKPNRKEKNGDVASARNPVRNCLIIGYNVKMGTIYISENKDSCRAEHWIKLNDFLIEGSPIAGSYMMVIE